MNDILDMPLSAFDDELEHHGIKGQKWGIRNAEWYPIEAYNRAKGIVSDAANSDTAKAVKSGAKTAAVATGKAVKKTASVTSKLAKKAASKASEMHQRSKEKKAAKRQVVEEKKAASFENEKKRIINSGTPAEVLSIADKLTNEELNYVRTRNQLIRDVKDLENRRIKDVKDKEFRQKWGKLLDASETVRTLSQPVDDVATALQRFKKFQDAVNALKKKDDTKDKISKTPEEILKNRNKATDEEVRKAATRANQLAALEKLVKTDDSSNTQTTDVTGSRHFKNSKAVREAMRVAKSEGWGALNNKQKALLSGTNSSVKTLKADSEGKKLAKEIKNQRETLRDLFNSYSYETPSERERNNKIYEDTFNDMMRNLKKYSKVENDISPNSSWALNTNEFSVYESDANPYYKN